MKPLERIFFMACVHEQQRKYLLADREFSVREIAKIFERLGFPYKQLMYYVQKWSDRGFYDYGVALDLGWFYLDKLTGEYLVIYNSMPYSENWGDGEFAKYIVQATHKNKSITNFAMRCRYRIGEDDKFYGEK